MLFRQLHGTMIAQCWKKCTILRTARRFTICSYRPTLCTIQYVVFRLDVQKHVLGPACLWWQALSIQFHPGTIIFTSFASPWRVFVSQVFSVHPWEDWNALASEYAPLPNFKITTMNCNIITWQNMEHFAATIGSV